MDRNYLQLIPALVVGALVGWLLDSVHVPVAWLLGPMLVGVLIAVLRGREQPLPPILQTVGQAILGLTTGAGFPLETLRRAAEHGGPLLLVVIITGTLSMLNGYLLWRWAGVDRATGFLGALPGAAPSMVAMSDEMGADPVAVAVLQYLRLLMVVFLAPLAVSLLFPVSSGAVQAAVDAGNPVAPMAANLAVIAICGALGVWGGRKLRVPSPTFLGPVLVMLVVSWTLPYRFVVPAPLFAAGLLLVGLSIGVRFDLPRARMLGKAVLMQVGFVVMLIAAGLVVGYVFHLWTGVATMTAVLGSTPGGMDVMVASAVEMGADPGLVLAMQLTRWFMILLLGPWLTARLIQRAVRKADDSANRNPA